MGILGVSMKEKKKISCGENRIFFEILLGIVLTAGVFFFLGIWFETNDDFVIYSMLSGVVSGRHEFHTMHNSVIFSLPMSLLYTLTDKISWYGFFYLFLHLLAFVLPVHSASSICKKLSERVIVYVTAVMIFVLSLFVQAQYQYTSIGLIMASVGYICLFLDKNKKRKIIFFIITEALAYGIRPETMELIQPMGLLVFIGFKLGEKDIKFKEIVKETAIVLSISVGIILIGFTADKLAYSSDEWAKAKSVNGDRIVMSDYNGMPNYDEVKDILNRNNVTKEEYEAFTEYALPDFSGISDAMHDLAEYSDSNYSSAGSIPDTIKNVYYSSYRHNLTYRINLAVIAAWIVTIVILIVFGGKKDMLPVLLYMLGKGISWGYIFYKGRVPIRILIPLYIFEAEIALCISLYVFIKRKKKKFEKALIAALLVFLGSLTAYSGKIQADNLIAQKNAFSILNNTQEILMNYIEENSDKKIILGQELYMYWKISPFECINPDLPNFMYECGWFSCLPTYIERSREFLNADELYLITVEEEDYFKEKEMAYYTSVFGNDFEIIDTIPMPTGANAVVYKIR